MTLKMSLSQVSTQPNPPKIQKTPIQPNPTHGWTQPITNSGRYVVKYCGQSGQAIKLFQASRKISFTFHVWYNSFVLDDVKLAELSNNSFEWKNMTF